MSYDADLNFPFSSPTKILFGINCVQEIGAEMDYLRVKRAFLITDRGLADNPIVARVQKALGKRCVGTFTEVIADSGAHIVEMGATLARAAGADVLVSVGGGSSIDTAKCMALLLTEGGHLFDHQGYHNLTRPVTPHISVPTTAGTGSEVSYVAVVKDHERNVKIHFGDYHLAPSIALLDPAMTIGLPPHLTAATGMDALTHAIEALHSVMRNPISDGLAIHAIRLIAAYLPRAVASGQDLLARGQMLLAANMAGSAFTNAMVALNHAIAHILGAKYNIHHGLANSLVLPSTMRFNRDACADRYALVAQAMGMQRPDMSAAEAAILGVEHLIQAIGLPQRLRDAGVPEDGLAAIAEGALTDGAIVNNPIPVTESEQVLAVCRAAW